MKVKQYKEYGRNKLLLRSKCKEKKIYLQRVDKEVKQSEEKVEEYKVYKGSLEQIVKETTK